MIASAPPSARTFAVSIVARSMVTEPMLRVSRARSPLAVMSICSPALAALKSSVSVPPSPSTVSLASPGSHWKRSLPLPRRAVSAPRLPSATSSPEPPISVSPNAPPRRVSLPAPPSSVIGVAGAPPAWKTMSSSSPPPPLTSTARERGAVDRVLDAAVGADVERDVRRLVEEEELVAGCVAGDLQGAFVDLQAGGGARGSGEREGRGACEDRCECGEDSHAPTLRGARRD